MGRISGSFGLHPSPQNPSIAPTPRPTNATRSLLNTAKVMAENPVMLRLKELEALETIAGKVEHLTIHNGTSGLMNDIVRLSDG